MSHLMPSHLITALLLFASWAFTPLPAAEVPSFEHDVVPLLTRFGCNSGACHGKLSGKNGFRLSLRGYAPELDYETIVREARGRRLNPTSPSQSLLVAKAINAVPHGGGARFSAEDRGFELLVDWIAAGTPGPTESSGRSGEEAALERLEITPSSAQLTVGQSLPIQVLAWYADGHSRDVTWLTQFESRDSSIVEVTAEGRATAVRHGETVVRASFRHLVEIVKLTIPYEEEVNPQWYTARNNAIDAAVFAKLADLHLTPSPLCDDATFMRRVSLDVIGTLPTTAEVRSFLADGSANKRELLVDSLLERPEFVDFWALQLGDLLLNRKERDHDVRGTKGVRAMHQWLRRNLTENANWRSIATEVLTATGDCDTNPAVGFYIVTVGEQEAEKSEVADAVAQAFLGTRIGCAKCHNHPLEKYTQDDYYHFVSYFTRVAMNRQKPELGGTQLVVGTRHFLNLQNELDKQRSELQQIPGDDQDASRRQEIEKRIADLQRQIEEHLNGPVTAHQPRTNERLAPRPLDRSDTVIAPGEDPRQALSRWMTDPANEHFSGAMVNRLWKHFLGVGLVEPVDDLRATNPPSNQPLWELLNREFVQSDFDLRHMMRLIVNSRTYQLAADTNENNVRDTTFYSHFYPRRLQAEVLLDAICMTTGQSESFAGYPVGVRAISIPDSGVDSYFLSLFGRSERTTACACERKTDITLPQLLHLQNSDDLVQKIKSTGGALSQWVAETSDDSELLDTVFLTLLGRLPSTSQRDELLRWMATEDRLEVMQDLVWALLNSKEFAFNR